ncbi:PAS domain S-box protein [Mucilaginibacter sp. 21P]|uniref:ATP-binding protein n=1 Tax=Mucilaginibacter sp. 21P TaxID=2778902 RepID=UPI001C55A58C|nr:ATP-binding protein [Mucilaginibacter sp. 21P]QXV63685.1 PAS domain S-box protein [Mucilaginibacter sp. 21P]
MEHQGHNNTVRDPQEEINDLKKELEILKSQQNRFKTIFETSDVAQKIIDKDLKIMEANQAMADLLGYSLQELLGTEIMTYTHADFKERWQQLQVALWHRELPKFRLEACLLKKDGTEVWCIIHTILFTNDGKTFGYTLLEDITSRKQLERHKDQFVSVVAHELRTPLTTIKSQSQLLERGLAKESESRLQELTTGINKHVNRLTRLIDNLVMVSKIEKGLTISAVENYSLTSLIKDVLGDLRLTNPHREFSEKFSGDLQTNGDEDKIRQVLYNLVNNAIKFSSAGTNIDISLHHEEQQAVICIQDHGAGIPKEDHDQIFKRFYQVEGNADKHLAGMGLGLYIADEIIRQQGGKLWVDSEEGKGSTFCFTVPSLSA